MWSQMATILVSTAQHTELLNHYAVALKLSITFQ